MLDKLRFIFNSKSSACRDERSKKVKNGSRLARVAKRIIITIAIVIVSLFVFGIYLTYNTAPSVYVMDFYEKKLSTKEASYTLRGHLSSGHPSELTINGEPIELIGNDFALKVDLKPGDNQFNIEAKNTKGTSGGIYIIRLEQ